MATRKPRRWRRYITWEVAKEAVRRGLKTRSMSLSRDDMVEVYATEEEFAALQAMLRKEGAAAGK